MSTGNADSVEKVACKRCGAKILPQTAKKFDGYCAHCGAARSISPSDERKLAFVFGERQGTVLGEAIVRGIYKPDAGTEKLGYFDPEFAPFRAFPGGRLALLHGSKANELIQMFRTAGEDAVRKVYGSTFDRTGDIAVDIARKLGLSSTEEVARTFEQLERRGNISEFLLVTTTMPFFLTYSRGDKVWVLPEIDLELKVNALANLLLNDPEFSQVHSVKDFRKKLESLIVMRRKEFEGKRQWAIEFQKAKGV